MTTLKATVSPSRIADFSGCPLRFRYRNIDRLPERPGMEALRGTIVHKVLEDMFDLPREDRTEHGAKADLRRAFDAVLEEDPGLRFAIDAGLQWPDDANTASAESTEQFLASLPQYIERYFLIERPDGFDPAHREQYVRDRIDDDLWLHGFVDRIDIAPTGEVRIVDYKTGRSPGPKFQQKALFQLKCYALLWQRMHDVPVRRLLMLFLGDGQRLVHDPTPSEISRAQEDVRSIWSEMKRANELARWEAKPSKLCDWCSFQMRCPAKSSHTPTFEPVPIELPERP